LSSLNVNRSETLVTGDPIQIDFLTGNLAGRGVNEVTRTLGELDGVFRDNVAWSVMDPARLVYKVQRFRPVAEGVEGGLFWGTTFVQPGLVGDEYFMTKGHFHSLRDRSEYYLTIKGEGALILMDEHRKTRFEVMRPGSLHYVPSGHAHRVANTGSILLTSLACWPSDAGHDYESVTNHGFSCRLRLVHGSPLLVEEP
jgi:glucose-6-phosphate isomerase, archaeal